VTDNGTRSITVGFYGGVGLPRTLETKRAQIASLVRWKAITLTKAKGVDAQIGNHPLNDEGLERMEQLALPPRRRTPTPMSWARRSTRTTSAFRRSACAYPWPATVSANSRQKQKAGDALASPAPVRD
jgi:hypothetical protein